MPTVPKQVKCAHLGCKEHRSKLNTYCIEHGGLDHTAHNDSDNSYSTVQWRKIRALQLSRQPLCQSCLLRGRVETANHVDHLFPWKRIGYRAFTRNIMQSLCLECHSHKTGLERQGKCQHYDKDGLKVYTIEDYGAVVAAHLRE